MVINQNIFNVSKSLEGYSNPSLFFGEPPGLFDTVNRRFPKIWSLYKEMKSLDWSEDEFDYSQCNVDFKQADPDTADMMIKTLAWQWEADSVASRSIIMTFAPFITSSEYWAAVSRVSDNEIIHAATYSEIVRMSFDNPHEVLSEILAVKEAVQRLETIAEVFNQGREAGLRYAQGQEKLSQELYNKVYLTVVALLLLERIQFMASFAITFTIGGSGLFQPICKAIQKIAQDELEVHCELDKEVLRTEHLTEMGIIAREQTKDIVKKMFHEVVESELTWLDYLFEGRALIGTNKDIVKKWVLFNAKDVAHFLNIETEYKFPKTNPMPHMENWLNMNKHQAAPQEQDLAQYKVNIIVNDDTNAKFDVDF